MAKETVPKTAANAKSVEETTKRDVTDIIWHVGEPTEAPLITLTGGKLYFSGKQTPENVPGKIKKEISKAVTYEVIEKDPLARTVTVNGAVADTTTLTVTLDDNTNLMVKNYIMNITQADGERMYVTALDSGGADITVRRNLGGTEFTIADGDVLQIVGFADKESGEKAAIRQQLGAPRKRNVQILKRTFGISNTMKQIQLETGAVNAWGEERTQALVEHKKDIEYTMWWNANADSTTDADGTTVNLTRGIIPELTAAGRFSTYTGDISETFFFGEFAESVFEFGPQKKVFFVDSRLKTIMGEWSRVKQQTKPMETKYGISVVEIETNHGTLQIMTNGAFNRFLPDSQKGFGVVCDLERFVYKHLAERDSYYEEDVQTPGLDAKEAQYITEAGMSLRSLKHHLVLRKAGV
jgi:hypothetical protein